MMSLGPMRGRIAVARGYLGRAATLTGAAALTAAAFTGDWAGMTLAGTGAATAWGLLWSATLPPGRVRDIAGGLYLTPATSALVLFAAERLLYTGSPWWLAADAAWTTGVWWGRPARAARVLVGREPSLTVEAVQEARDEAPAGLVPAVDRHPMAVWWSEHAAVEDGVAPGTLLERIEQTGPTSMTALIRSAHPGTPVPTISITRLSALLNWDEEEITVTKMSGHGAGVRRLTVGRAPQQADDVYGHWVQNIAPKGMAGTTITGIRIVEAGREVEA